jgi:hypothetical protein
MPGIACDARDFTNKPLNPDSEIRVFVTNALSFSQLGLPRKDRSGRNIERQGWLAQRFALL